MTGFDPDLASREAHIRVLREPERGTGLAVRRGILEAEGENRFICDGGLSMPIEMDF